MIIGNAGGGKSSISKEICRVNELPYFEIDKFLWRDDWSRVPDDVFEAEHEKILSGARWLIDGFGTEQSVLRRLDACEVVIFVEHPLYIHFWWATKRQFGSLFGRRESTLKWREFLSVTVRLYRVIGWMYKEMRPKLMSELNARAEHLEVIHIKSPAELMAFQSNPVWLVGR